MEDMSFINLVLKKMPFAYIVILIIVLIISLVFIGIYIINKTIIYGILMYGILLVSVIVISTLVNSVLVEHYGLKASAYNLLGIDFNIYEKARVKLLTDYLIENDVSNDEDIEVICKIINLEKRESTIELITTKGFMLAGILALYNNFTNKLITESVSTNILDAIAVSVAIFIIIIMLLYFTEKSLLDLGKLLINRKKYKLDKFEKLLLLAQLEKKKSCKKDFT